MIAGTPTTRGFRFDYVLPSGNGICSVPHASVVPTFMLPLYIKLVMKKRLNQSKEREIETPQSIEDTISTTPCDDTITDHSYHAKGQGRNRIKYCQSHRVPTAAAVLSVELQQAAVYYELSRCTTLNTRATCLHV